MYTYQAAHKNLEDAITFGKTYGFKVTSAEDPDGSKHDAAFGAALLALQAACEAGAYRVRIEEATEPADLSWDDTGETATHLDSGHFVNVYGCLDRWDDASQAWVQVDGVGEVIGTREDVGRLVWCYAADWFTVDSKQGPVVADNDDCDYLPGIPGQPFTGVAVQTVPEWWSFSTSGGDCAGILK